MQTQPCSCCVRTSCSVTSMGWMHSQTFWSETETVSARWRHGRNVCTSTRPWNVTRTSWIYWVFIRIFCGPWVCKEGSWSRDFWQALKDSIYLIHLGRVITSTETRLNCDFWKLMTMHRGGGRNLRNRSAWRHILFNFTFCQKSCELSKHSRHNRVQPMYIVQNI